MRKTDGAARKILCSSAPSAGYRGNDVWTPMMKAIKENRAGHQIKNLLRHEIIINKQMSNKILMHNKYFMKFELSVNEDFTSIAYR